MLFNRGVFFETMNGLALYCDIIRKVCVAVAPKAARGPPKERVIFVWVNWKHDRIPMPPSLLLSSHCV